MLYLQLNLLCQFVVSVCVFNLVRVSIRSFYLKPIPHIESINNEPFNDIQTFYHILVQSFIAKPASYIGESQPLFSSIPALL